MYLEVCPNYLELTSNQPTRVRTTVLLVLQPYIEVSPHVVLKRGLWRSKELLVQLGRFYFLLGAFLLLHVVLVFKKVLGRRKLSS